MRACRGSKDPLPPPQRSRSLREAKQVDDSPRAVVPAAQPEASPASWLSFHLGKQEQGRLCWAKTPMGALCLQGGQGLSPVWLPGLCLPLHGAPGACLRHLGGKNPLEPIAASPDLRQREKPEEKVTAKGSVAVGVMESRTGDVAAVGFDPGHPVETWAVEGPRGAGGYGGEPRPFGDRSAPRAATESAGAPPAPQRMQG